ncbi:MAG: alpha/beta fold hydrolase [Ramlibacter sp.]
MTNPSQTRAAFVLVHGAFHGAWCFERVLPLLAGLGHAALARDLPAHGLHARFPAAYTQRPLNPAAFAVEPSPVAGTALEDYVASIIATIDQVRAMGHQKVVLVGHSMGGVPVTAVAERVPERIHRLVYLTAFMPASGVPAISYIQAPENAGELVGPHLMADPAVVGALRIDQRSSDAAYNAGRKLAFYGDVAQAEYDAVAHLLTPDVPVAPFATPIVLTAGGWGSVDRHYIRCTQDMAIRPALQQRFIDEADAFVPGRKTTVHTLDTSHSPFISAPQALAQMLHGIAA